MFIVVQTFLSENCYFFYVVYLTDFVVNCTDKNVCATDE